MPVTARKNPAPVRPDCEALKAEAVAAAPVFVDLSENDEVRRALTATVEALYPASAARDYAIGNAVDSHNYIEMTAHLQWAGVLVGIAIGKRLAVSR